MSLIIDFLPYLAGRVFASIPQPKPQVEAIKNAKIIAHRGDHTGAQIKENTMEAFSACKDNRIWGIEFDVRWTKDNIPVVHHDETTERVFGKKKSIIELSLEDLKKEFPKIPSLKEVIDHFASQLHLMIELKTELTSEQVRTLEELLAPLKPVQDYHLMSLRISHFDLLTSFPRACFVGIATTNMNAISQEIVDRELGALTGHYLLLSNKVKTKCLEKGIKTGTGYIDNKNLAYREINRGIDWLFSNKAIEVASHCSPTLEQSAHL